MRSKKYFYPILTIALSGLFLYLLITYWDRPLITKHQQNDSDAEREIAVQAYTDSSRKSIENRIAFDTLNDEPCPIEIISSRLYRSEYSSRRGVAFIYKNVSTKTINAARFKWYGVDAFGEPADMGSYVLDGFGGGFDDDPIGPMKTRSVEYSVLSSDAKNIVKIWVTQVAFADGTQWHSKSAD